MNKEIQAQIDAQIAKGNPSSAPTSVLPKKTLSIDEVLARDRRQTDIVEINIANQQATLVETSDAPPLTVEVLAEKGKKTKTAELVFEDIQSTGEPPEIEVLNGVPFSVEVARTKILREFQNKETKKDEYEKNLAVLRLLVSKMVVAPKFSFRGKGEGSPIEEQSDLLLEAFYESILKSASPPTMVGTHKDLTALLESLNEKRASLEKDLAEKKSAVKKAPGPKRKALNTEIQELTQSLNNTRAGAELTELAITHVYQVKVLRGTPLHAALLSDSFEFYPTSEGKPLLECSDAELDAEIERREAERYAFVSSMILSPSLSWNGEGKEGAYAVELIGESMMQGLYNAHTAVNVKPGGLAILQRFRQMGENRKWL